MATEYVVYKRYENRVGEGKLPDVETMYLAESLPHIELTINIREAMTFSESEAKHFAYITCMDCREVRY